MPKFICSDEYGRFSEYTAVDAKTAIEKHVCDAAQRAGCVPQDLASFTIYAYEVASPVEAYWKTWHTSSGKLEMKGQTK